MYLGPEDEQGLPTTFRDPRPQRGVNGTQCDNQVKKLQSVSIQLSLWRIGWESLKVDEGLL